jgi:predicted nucleic acid-binding protein
MKPTLVIDASVSVKWFVPQSPEVDDVPAALALLQAYADDRVEFYQPSIWQSEVLAALARVAPASVERHVCRFLAFDYVPAESPAVFLKAVQMAVSLGHHLFDTVYHAAALTHPNAVLITADVRYVNKAASLGRILPLSQWQEVLAY